MNILGNIFWFIRNNPKRTAIGVVVFLLFIYAGFIKPPNNFNAHHVVVIEDGYSISQTAHLLEKEAIVQSSFFFSVMARMFGGDTGVLSGSYIFSKPLTLFGVWGRVSRGETGEELVRITFPEGATSREMALIVKSELPGMDVDRFRELARAREGYLFPETYAVSPNISAEQLVRVMEKTFVKEVETIEDEIDAFGAPLEDVVVMASLLEKEARLYETRQKVAGILWKRMEIGMPLQVDAVFGYILDTDTFNPTFDDLEIDSPYNTYENLGLPPGAIANPGLEALRAAVNPIETPYLYYLTGADGTMHYARTFDQHVENRRFLR